MSRRRTRLLLDQMLSPRIADELTRRGHDVVALAAEPELRALSDADVYAWASEQRRRVVTENGKDFRPLVVDGSGPGVLFTSNRTFPRSRRNLGPVVDALDRWLIRPGRKGHEEWLAPDPR